MEVGVAGVAVVGFMSDAVNVGADVRMATGDPGRDADLGDAWL